MRVADGAVVAVVTGASRGAGRGIAVALGRHGSTVYVTGRSQDPRTAAFGRTVHETAAAVTAAGGRGIPVVVDHADDEQVRALFERVERESGRLDVLVNNACALPASHGGPVGFWEKPLALADMFDVGLRSGYVATYYAAPLLVRQGRGLVVFTSGSGAVHYVFHPPYGATKAGVDKLAADMAVDFCDYGVATVSVWMGPLRTERMLQRLGEQAESTADLETPELTGHVVWALYKDPELAGLSGRTLIGAELAVRYGIEDEDGRRPASYRDTFGVEPHVQYVGPVIR